MDIGSVLSGPLGVIVGAVGSLGSKVIDYKMAGQKYEFDLQLRDKDMAQAKQEAEAKYEVAKLETETTLAVKDLDNIAVSIAADRATYGTTWVGQAVDFARGLTRPMITWVSTSMICYVVFHEIKVGLSGEQVERILNDAIFTCSTAITWWFGSRPNKR